MRSQERDCGGKEKALHFSASNDTFFFLLFEQGTLRFYFALGPAHWAAGSLPSPLYLSTLDSAPKEKCLNLLIFFCPLEMTRGCMFP